MSIELKIKSKHLTEEARIIRFEERKLKRKAKWERENQSHEAAENSMAEWRGLNAHRRHDVRNENRATFLARAYLDGKPYSVAEQKRKSDKEYNFRVNILPRVLTMINKYAKGSDKVTMEEIILWTAIPE